MTAGVRRWPTWLAAGLLCLLAGCATAYQSGRTALHEGRWADAEVRFREALAGHPERVEARLGLGLAQYHLGSFDAALASLGSAVEAAPDRAVGRLYLALTHLARGDQEAAARQLDGLRGLDLHPRLAAQAERAAGLLRTGPLATPVREFVRQSLEDGADWQQEVLLARLAPHMYFGPSWYVRDPAGWSPLGWYPYGVPTP
jgi:tetratricopeptide (TPR) repeat protein